MNVLIIEDEPAAARQLQRLVCEMADDVQVLGVLDSIESAVDWFDTQPQPDLLLLDIELSDGQSFDIFLQTEVKCPVIFTTAYDEYALRAFEVNSVDYLLKPVQKTALQRALEKFLNLKKTYAGEQPAFRLEELIRDLSQRSPSESPVYRDRFLVRLGQRLLPVEASEIAYFYSHNKLTFLKTRDDRQYALDYSLDELEQSLNPRQFYRANRQFIISHKAIEKVHLYFTSKLKLNLQPVTEEEVIVSKEKAGAFRKWMGE